ESGAAGGSRSGDRKVARERSQAAVSDRVGFARGFEPAEARHERGESPCGKREYSGDARERFGAGYGSRGDGKQELEVVCVRAGSCGGAGAPARAFFSP